MIAAPVYRIVRTEHDPFLAPPRTLAGKSRFDCPVGSFGVIYAASTPAAAYGEIMAQHRPKLAALALVEETSDSTTVENSPQSDAQGSALLPPSTIAPIWITSRHIDWTTVDASLRCADLVHPDTVQALRPALASLLTSKQIADLDMAALFSADRAVTQHIASYLHRLHSIDGHPVIAGIRYPSRLHLGWECWALFADRLQHGPVYSRAVEPDEPGFQEACRVLNLDVAAAG